MRTKFHLLTALILLIFYSCSKDELTPEEIIEETSFKSFNNGMVKSYTNETIIKWNDLLGSVIDEKLPVPLEAKIYAMVTLSIHDALNNVVPFYETYALDNSLVNATDISKNNIQMIADAAVSQAARDVMVSLFPPAASKADPLLDEVLSTISDEGAKNKGVAIGMQAAIAMLQKREGDFPFIFTEYTAPSNEPGVYQADFPPYIFPNSPIWPAYAIYAPNLGNLSPFGIRNADQFLDEGSNAVSSSEYTNDYMEIKSVGCQGCPDRTPDQSEIALFWIENIASSANRMARTLIMANDLDGWESARLIALLEMSVMDSFIASFREKAEFVYWAPITAVRSGDTDGNPETAGDPTWVALGATPPVFEFPSTQAYASGATSEIFRLFFKKNNIALTLESPYYLPGIQRSFNSFSDYSKEQSEARIS